MWHLRNAHTSGAEQSELMAQPSPGLVCGVSELAHAPARRIVVSAQKKYRIRWPYQTPQAAIIGELVYHMYLYWTYLDAREIAGWAYVGHILSSYH